MRFVRCYTGGVENTSASSSRKPGPVRRLTFEYDGDHIKLVSNKPVTMIVPPTQPLDAAPTHGALSLVVRDQANRPLYRATHESPIRHDAEVFSREAGGSVQRVAVEHPKGAFTVLVPDLPAAHELDLVGHPLKPEAHAEPPQRLGTYSLKPPAPQ